MSITIHAKWQGQTQSLTVPSSGTVGELVESCMSAFGLATCKLIGLVKGKLPEAETRLATLHPDGAEVKVMLIGQPRQSLAAMGEQESLFEAARLVEAERAAREESLRAAAAAREAEARAAYEAAEAVRRQEREEQRRRDHAEWMARREVEEREARERELRAEQDVRNVISLELQAFHAPALDSTNKILLPPHALQEIVNAKVQFPLTFQLMLPSSADAVQAETNAAAAAAATEAHHAAASSAEAAATAATSNDAQMETTPSFSLAASSSSSSLAPGPSASPPPIMSPLVTYSAVQDFTAPIATVSVPASVLTALGAADGAKLRLTTVNLRKAEHIVIQPLTAAWLRLPEMERRALLELQLRKHTFLAQNTRIAFTYHAHLPMMEFHVVETKPDPVVSITDTELATEILPFEDGTAMSDSPPATAGQASSPSLSPSPSPSPLPSATRLPSASPTPTYPSLVADESVSGRLAAGGSAYFTYEVTDGNARVTFDLTAVRGDPDLYVLNTDSSESTVDVAHFTWMAQSKGTKSISMSTQDALFHTGTWQVLVRAYGADAEFAIVVRESPASDATTGYQLGASISRTDGTPPVAADMQVCTNCKASVSAKSMSLHSLQCARLNHCCAQCGLVFRTSDREKHDRLVHAAYTCLCGVQLDQSSMVAHKRDACPARLVSCQYCPLRIIARDRGPHQQECGLLHSHCPLCAQSMPRKVMRRHLVKEHGGINGKTDERDITHQDFWG